jgi:hypothetical protein
MASQRSPGHNGAPQPELVHEGVNKKRKTENRLNTCPARSMGV